ncbi:5'-3' exoribonuclease 2 [Dichomitus squalens LYAD-421 SS1]|uniref:5'-3' exoribonuclease 2 n=1 Tax=Dichomitus squalens (strain LYAD-421) TaxID=732165 RepID=UPI000441244A|nr:5'-3' exoribonuclease 2 [Dichomitus squalens LYAD-421 SS1]EJF62888.1 5'-3' exoribonuclease 2 [Dichomitus squalens LYAD-421 SS1]
MGVPALFRWLSKKYPKIILPVIEAEQATIPDTEGNEVAVPVNIADPNPNGVEFDSLYLDMNGIVHPCTHPEGKPAPETEEEMMIEIFSYTERVVNMVRPRKLLFMAIDGVAPRAKMNQQRSRRFRSAQEAKEKEEARKESIAMWEAMGKTLSEEEKNKKAWDSNAITPGTPFMDLLASSLRYWVVYKMNTDPGWKDVQVIISDASVPGEGEHKIMDFIRRQRSNPGHDPNTHHVIYGLDADLIMLSLATHEPHFRVLREDVFHQEGSRTACRICGQEGHYAAQCTGTKAEIKKTPPEKKPFIFLDVAILREYLEAELNVPNVPFPFNFEQAIDDWVLLIFFVGNDFLPHLPSLEIREGAIDTLLKIWRTELPRMGGYITNHGQLELSRAQIILEGLARREDEIFRRRREAEERQDQNAKRRKIEKETGSNGASAGPSPSLNLTVAPVAPGSLPPRPDFAAKADSIGLGGPKNADTDTHTPTASLALAGSNRDVVANRAAIRLANMSAAEMLKAEMASLIPLKPSKSATKSSTTANSAPPPPVAASAPAREPSSAPDATITATVTTTDDADIPGLGGMTPVSSSTTVFETPMSVEPVPPVEDGTDDVDGEEIPAGAEDSFMTDAIETELHGVKRSIDEVEAEDAEDPEDLGPSDDDDAPAEAETSYVLKVNPDGTVDQEDQVKLWEPGYRERYYSQKFGAEYSDKEFRKQVTKSYIEGMAWVLQYYYQGTPSWHWYYPFHFAPFAADFEDLDKMDIDFTLGQPFKPFEQLMGVFPASSRSHIPATFHDLMTEDTSPIIDFYPSTFQIDMNGKRMAWQGVALLPFIDEKRLLDAMGPRYPNLSDDEKRRNQWGNNFLFVYEAHALYPTLEALYGKRKKDEPLPINPKLSKGINGSLLPNPDCIPDSTYFSPLPSQDLPNIKNDRSLSAFYFFPKQLTPHRSILLPGVRRPQPVLNAHDLEVARRGGPERGRGRGRGGFHSERGGRDNYGGYNNQSRGFRPGGGEDRYQNGGSYQPYQQQASYINGGYQQQQSYQAYQSYQRGRGGYQQPSSNSSRGQYNDFTSPSRGGRGGGRGNYGGGGAAYTNGPPGGYGNQGGGYGGGGRGGGYGGYGGGGNNYNQGGGGYGQGGYNPGGGYGGQAGYTAGGNYGYGGNQQSNGYGGGGGGGYGNSRGGHNNRGRGRGGRY